MNSPSFWLQKTLSSLFSLLEKERRIGAEILEILNELERRKAYAELRYDGLFSFCVGELKFTESQAFQRIQAKIAELKGEKRKERLTFEMDEELVALWIEAKALCSNQSQGNEAKALKVFLTEWLKAKSKTRGKVKPDETCLTQVGLTQVAASHVSSTQQAQIVAGAMRARVKKAPASPGARTKLFTQKKQRYFPVQIKRAVSKRDAFRCKICGSKHFLQHEHKMPFAKGGSHDPGNLTLLCRSCNLHRGIKEFGLHSMRRH